ncbi:uncharacterized protein PHACADRAFT_248626 [Phanerochaete carnosa HHB-10118-sp]|uniref:Uncharacterized protein n=1 Tax=Phanerochaete carnosa (strain HHB-10118-sp) TaxID=650164 RepID=K5XFA9_PHACS|nr:uncharacterized protein PHACADRAFT_248626 [Phanerochaete carnosa HHB-10118-sp]EKM61777.1 hypothetical protein PHACADRAFT_248626 [Phanerochaete carnosa HHB-10118-sp]
MEDIGWSIDHAHHCIGLLVPLMTDDRYSLLTAGGLLLLWDNEEKELWVVSTGFTLGQLVAAYRLSDSSRLCATGTTP